MFRDAVNSNLAFQDYENIHLKKSQNFHSFKGVRPWFGSKLFVFCEIAWERGFSDVVNRKLTFLVYKRSIKGRQINCIFLKGLDRSFDQKCEIFLLFVFGKIGQEKVFSDAVGRKLAFLVYKNIDLRKSQNLHFSKRVSPWF